MSQTPMDLTPRQARYLDNLRQVLDPVEHEAVCVAGMVWEGALTRKVVRDRYDALGRETATQPG